MYDLDGIHLHDVERGWTLRSGTRPLVSIAIERASVTIPGYDGSVAGLPGSAQTPRFPIVIETPRAKLPALRTLLRRGTRLTETDHPEREAVVQLISLSPEGFGDAEEVVDVTAIYEIPGVYWRDTVASTSDSVALASASVELEVLDGISAPVRDAVVRAKGGVTGLKVLDAGGTYFRHTDVLPSGSYLRFEAESGRAWVTATDVWVGGTEVTQAIETGPGPYNLELSPHFTTDPEVRAALLTVTSTARTGSPVIEVRAKGAYEH